MSLESDLEQIDGVGPATVEKITDVVAEHQDDSDGEVNDHVERALVLLRRGRDDLALSALEEALGA